MSSDKNQQARPQPVPAGGKPVNSKPDYQVGDNAATNDGRVISWGLEDVAFELRTANLIAFYGQIDKPHDRASQELHEMIVKRLGLRDEEDRHVDQ